MKKIILPALFIFVSSGLLLAQTIKTVSAEEFEKKLSATKDKILLDVRTDKEFSQGHLAGATDIDFYQSNFRDNVSKLDKTKPVFIYCLSGGRSSKAASILTELGFKTIYNLDGGYRAWSAANKPVTK